MTEPSLVATAMMGNPTTAEPDERLANGTGYELHGPPYWEEPVKIVYSCIMVTFMVLAFFGNVMVLTVIGRHKSMRTRTNMFIANLAITDFLVSILNMPFSLGTVIYGDWPFGDVMCQINGFLMPLLFICSEHTLMYLAVFKFVTIYYPLKQYITFRRVAIMIVAAWLVSGTLSLLAMTGLNHILYKPFTTQCGPAYPIDVYGYTHVVLMTIFTYIVPVAVMAFSYIKMFIEIRAYGLRLEKHTNQDKQTIIDQQKRVVVTMFIVMTMFLLCWTPYTVYAVSSSIVKNKERIPHNFNAFAYLCGYMNSSLNPIIYGFRNKSFRNGYKEFFCQGRDLGLSEADNRPPSDEKQNQRQNLILEGEQVKIKGDLPASGVHNTLTRMASTISNKIIPRGRKPSMQQGDAEKNASERQALVSPTKKKSFKDCAKKVTLSSGAIAYMKNGKIIKVLNHPDDHDNTRQRKASGVGNSLAGGTKSVSGSDKPSSMDELCEGGAETLIIPEETKVLPSEIHIPNGNPDSKTDILIDQSAQLGNGRPAEKLDRNSSDSSLYDNVPNVCVQNLDSDLEDEVFLPPSKQRVSTERHPGVSHKPSNHRGSDPSPRSPTVVSPRSRTIAGGRRLSSPTSPIQLRPLVEDEDEGETQVRPTTETSLLNPVSQKPPVLHKKPNKSNTSDQSYSHDIEMREQKGQSPGRSRSNRGADSQISAGAKNEKLSTLSVHDRPTERRLSNRELKTEFWNTTVDETGHYDSTSPRGRRKRWARLPSVDSLSPLLKMKSSGHAKPEAPSGKS